MKPSLIVALGLLQSGVLVGAETPQAFASPKLELPPLSLLDAARAALPQVFADRTIQQPVAARSALPTRRLVSRMPVVAPAKDFHARMPVKRPDESTDFKLAIKAPEVEERKPDGR